MTPSATAQDALHALLREVLPPQGGWSDEEYLWLTDRGRGREPAAGDAAGSRLLEGFAADVTAVFDAPKAGA